MSVVLPALLLIMAVFVVGSLVAMYVKDRPIYGVAGLCVLLGPGTILAFMHVALLQG
jgi:hypothetical protein